MATLDYTPRGLGFELTLIAGAERLSISGQGLDDDSPVVGGSERLRTNLALVTLALSFAANELAYRRFRAAEKRKSHREAAAGDRKQLLAHADLVVRPRGDSVIAWCSGCFARTSHVHVEGADRPGRVHLCGACGTVTSQCTVPGCRHHGVLKPTAKLSWTYCAEHHHEVPGFEKLDDSIPTLADTESFLSFTSRNADRITKVTAGTLGAAAAIAPMALVAAPAVGAALGSSVLGGSLTGAAATSHGLAMLGGGSLAAGGLGMAGGAAVVTATGTALGGALGAVTASAYTSADKSFAIERVREGVGAPVVFASGFLTEGLSSWSDWQPLIDSAYPDAPVYQVRWGSKELADLGALVASTGAAAVVKKWLVQGARRGGKKLGFPGLGWVLAAHGLVTNPWTVARARAEMTGAALAALISRSEEAPYVLMGHSLGARVMVSAAQALAGADGRARVESIHLFGAAVAREGDWRNLDASVEQAVWNYWSSNDAVLKILFRLAELGKTPVGAAGFTSKFPRIRDRNMSRRVAAHSDYLRGVKLVAPS